MTEVAEQLRGLPLLAGLGDEALQRLAASAVEVVVEAGEEVLTAGERPEGLYVVVAGRYEVRRPSGARDVAVGVIGPGEVLGEMALLAGTERSATVVALDRGRLLRIDARVLDELLADRATVRAILRTVLSRLHEREALLVESAKLAALGRFTAGVVHNLNNPAAAVLRSAGQIVEVVDELDLPAVALGSPAPLDPLERSEREERLRAWLETYGVPRAWQVARGLVEQGWDSARAEDLVADAGAAQAVATLREVARAGTLRRLAEQASTAAARISQIVDSVRGYVRLDSAPVGEVDVNAALDATLVVVRPEPGIRLVRDYATSLPGVEGYAAELNQVWTNLIDNALQAMGEAGELTLRTRPAGDGVVVEVIDTGPGIDERVRGRLFEAFSTTKPEGRGTGLGLYTVYNTVVERHGGAVQVESRPGRTCFRVRLAGRLRRD